MLRKEVTSLYTYVLIGQLVFTGSRRAANGSDHRPEHPAQKRPSTGKQSTVGKYLEVLIPTAATSHTEAGPRPARSAKYAPPGALVDVGLGSESGKKLTLVKHLIILSFPFLYQLPLLPFFVGNFLRYNVCGRLTSVLLTSVDLTPVTRQHYIGQISKNCSNVCAS